MEYINGVSSLYIRKFARKLEQYNHAAQLPAYFGPLIGDKKKVRIAEVGAGPINTIGNLWPGVEVEVLATDSLANEYKRQLWDKHTALPVVPVLQADMENLSMYPDDTFDIVHCRNALDHTKDARKAWDELERICKKGGWVYLAHSPMQKKRFGGHHYWNAEFTLYDNKELPPDFTLSEDNDCEHAFGHDGYKVTMEDNLIIAIWQKT